MAKELEECAPYRNNASINNQVIDDLKKFVDEKLVSADKALSQSQERPQQLQPKQLCLPFWPEAVRAVPNSILRSALFGVSKIRGACKNRTLIASSSEFEVRFTGDKFNQTDLDVFQGLLHLSMRRPIGGSVEFGLSSFLGTLGRNIGSSQKEKLREELTRLMGGVVEIKWMKEQKTFMGTLIQKAFIDELTGQYIIVFDHDLIKLFDYGHTYIDHQQRLQLGQHSLAKWLHGFYTSHANPYPYKLETIRDLCGSTASLKEFKRLATRALEKLVAIKSIESWHIEPSKDLLCVRKQKSYPQKRPI